jgi:hypothetical protein
MPVACPAPSRFQDALAYRLSAAEVEELAAHLEACPFCMAIVASQRVDPLSRLLRRGAPLLDDTSLPPEVQALIDRILRLPGLVEPRTVPAIPWGEGETVPTGRDFFFLEPAQQPGEIGRLGPYRILAQLGEGGMGVVFLAEDPRLERQVALKVMKPRWAARPEARERFLSEARAMAAVEHERIMPVYHPDEVLVGDLVVPYLAMPLLRGESLAARLQRPEPMPLPEVLRIGRETAEGLAAAHAVGLIHRDVKPANIFLVSGQGGPAQADQPPTVKLLDFGLAQVAADGSGLRQPGTLLGTPEYMAPEQAQGQILDGRADLFSLGCVLYELATGRPPFRGPSLAAILHQVARHQPPPARAINPGVPADLSALIDELLDKDPARRPPSAQAVAARLARLEDALTDNATTLPGAAADGRRACWWHWAGRLGLVSAAAVLLAVLALAYRPQAEPPLPPLKGSIDVRLFAPNDPLRQNLCLEDAEALPLRPGDEFCIEAELNRPAYAYVLWIDTEGKVLPVHPWRPGHWEDRPADDERVQRLRRPEALDHYYTIKSGTPGMETLVLLARETPLPRDVDLQTELGELPRPKDQGPQTTAWFENGWPVRNRRGRAGHFDETRRDDPVLLTQQRLRQRLLGRHFDYLLAVSFANRGR